MNLSILTRFTASSFDARLLCVARIKTPEHPRGPRAYGLNSRGSASDTSRQTSIWDHYSLLCFGGHRPELRSPAVREIARKQDWSDSSGLDSAKRR